ncbi:hypothetical protein [Streptomyces sp. NPDC060031]
MYGLLMLPPEAIELDASRQHPERDASPGAGCCSAAAVLLLPGARPRRLP